MAALSRIDTTSGVMMAAKLLLNWLDRNPCSLVEDYDSFRNEVLMSALNLASVLVRTCYHMSIYGVIIVHHHTAR